MKNRFWLLFFVSLCLLPPAWAAPLGQGQESMPAMTLENHIIKALSQLPHYGVFDSLSFTLTSNNVTLLGKVLLPITKDEAGKRVAKIAGVGSVNNNIEVLPLSPNDDQIRLKVYRRLFNTSDLYRYALGPMPSIHIIVKNGHVVLEGLVSSEADSHLALLAVKQVPGIFSVQNDLEVQK
jgi:hyperosmotically inducible periplasmic protein